MEVLIGINGTTLASDRSKGFLRVVRIEAGQSHIEVLKTFSLDQMMQATRYAENYAAKFSHVAFRSPFYIGPRL